MCCIFTCCGWMVDLIQRLWTFTMSCIISSAVVCALLCSSMAGIALGYNYSLAEYIDMKETNVSVYLKRGVFDDEIAEDMIWRRSGHQPVAGHIREDKLMTGASDDTTTLRSGRRLDDSIYQSQDRSNFEGSLMRLTAKPPFQSSTLMPIEQPISELATQYEMGSIDQLKAVQSMINMKKAEAAARRPTNNKQEAQIVVEKRPPFPGPGRRGMQYSIPTFERSSTYSSLRAAVPDDQINERSKWILPKLSPQSVPKDVQYIDYYMNPTYPSPVTLRPGPARPTRPKVFAKPRTRPVSTYTTTFIKPSRSPEINLPKSIDDDMETFKKKLIEDKFIPPMIKDDEFLKNIDLGKIKTNEDYEDEIKGVPMRKKRNIDISTLNIIFNNESKTDMMPFLVKNNTNVGSNFDSGLQENKVAPTLMNLETTRTNKMMQLISSAVL